MILLILVQWPEIIVINAIWNLILIKYLILFFLNSFLLQNIPAMETLLLLISFEGSSEAMMIHKESGLICWWRVTVFLSSLRGI